MEYPKLQMVLYMTKNGYECNEKCIDDIAFTQDNIFYLKGYDFNANNIKDWFCEFYDDIESTAINHLISNNIFKLCELISLYDYYYDLNEEFILNVEQLTYLAEYNIDDISDEHIKIYIEYNEHERFIDDDVYAAMLKRILSISDFYDKVFKDELIELDEDGIIEFFQRGDFDAFTYMTKEIILSNGFLKSFDNFPTNGIKSYSNYIEPKHEIAYMILEYFNNDEEIKKSFLYNLSYVYDEHLETPDEEATRLAKEEEYNKIENLIKRASERDRIQADNANRIIKEVYGLEKYINVHDGCVGLEDMTFSTIHIVGEIFEYNESFGKHWICGRDFGDNLISYNQFKRAIKYAQSLKDNKE